MAERVDEELDQEEYVDDSRQKQETLPVVELELLLDEDVFELVGSKVLQIHRGLRDRHGLYSLGRPAATGPSLLLRMTCCKRQFPDDVPGESDPVQPELAGSHGDSQGDADLIEVAAAVLERFDPELALGVDGGDPAIVRDESLTVSRLQLLDVVESRGIFLRVPSGASSFCFHSPHDTSPIFLVNG